MDNNYKNLINDIITDGIVFGEAYEVDDKEHFAIAPNDVVRVDLRPFINKAEADLRSVYGANYDQIKIDDVTGDVIINGKPAHTNNVASTDIKTVDNKAVDTNTDEEINPKTRENVVEFLKMLKANGSWDKLGSLDTETKKNIADQVLNALTQIALRQKKDNIKEQDINLNFEENILLETLVILEGVNEAYIRLDELKNIVSKKKMASNVDKKVAPASKTPASKTPASKVTPTQTQTTPAPAPATQPAPVPQVNAVDVFKDPAKFGIDANQEDFKKKKAYYDTLRKNYDSYKAIPGAKNTEILGIVKSSDDNASTVVMQLLKRTSTGQDGKAVYDDDKSTKPVTVPFNAIKRRTPATKAKGFLRKFLGI